MMDNPEGIPQGSEFFGISINLPYFTLGGAGHVLWIAQVIKISLIQDSHFVART